MEIKEIQNLIKFVAKSGASEVKLEMGDVKITIRTGKTDDNGEKTIIQQVPAMPVAAQPQAVPVQPTETPGCRKGSGCRRRFKPRCG